MNKKKSKNKTPRKVNKELIINLFKRNRRPKANWKH